MGSCLSCFRTKDVSSERDPLLPQIAQLPTKPERSTLEKSVDALAALQSGKLPSQEQLDALLGSISRSNVLQCDFQENSLGSGALSENGRRVLNDVREFLESVLQFGMEKNMDDRIQDLLYQSSQIQGPPMRMDADVAVEAGHTAVAELQAQAPTYAELRHDTAKIIKSLKAVARLLLTSTAFRLLLSDMFASARELLAQIAAEVGEVALQVQLTAETVEAAAHTEGSVSLLTGKVRDAVGEALENIEEAKRQSTAQETTRDAFIARVQDYIVRAHRDPQALSALRTILHITRKYAGKLSRSTDIISAVKVTEHPPAISVTPNSETSQALEDLKVLLERFASGHSLDPILHAFSDTVSSLTETAPVPPEKQSPSDPDLQEYLQSIDRWLSRALTPTPPSKQLYVTSRAGTRALENLYDGGRILFVPSSGSTPASAWIQNLRTLFAACDAYTTALTHDRSTMRLVNALSKLYSDSADLADLSLGMGNYAGHREEVWKNEVLRDFLGWVLPRIGGLLGRIRVPMPRVEYMSGKLMAALDALKMGPGEPGGVVLDYIPDSVVVRTTNEVRIDMANQVGTPSSYSRMHVHVDGLRVAVNEMGYFFRYGGRRKLFGYSDQGVLSVDIGSLQRDRKSTQGLTLDMDVALDTENRVALSDADTAMLPLFDVLDVRAALPDIKFKLKKSRHWVLNSVVVQPLAGPIVARVVTGILEARIRAVLEGLAQGIATLQQEARHIAVETRSGVHLDGNSGEITLAQEEEPGFSDYWEALLKKGPEAFGIVSTQEVSEDPTEVEVEAHTSTTATLKGVVHTKTTTTMIIEEPWPASSKPDAGPSREHIEEETSVAIGGGSILFPDEAGAYGKDEEGMASKAPVLDQVVQDVEGAVKDVEAAIEHTVEGAVELREEIQRAEERREERLTAERSRGGWRSKAFNI